MPDDFKVTPLFESTSMVPPALRRTEPPQQQAPGDALASALLVGIMTDLSVLKEFAHRQAGFNAAADALAREQLKLAEKFDVQLGEHAATLEQHDNLNTIALGIFRQFEELRLNFAKLAHVVAELDERLHALDGKRSVAVTDLTDETVAADTAATG